MALEIPIDPSWNEDLARWRAGEVWSEIRTREQDDTDLHDLYRTNGDGQAMPHRCQSLWLIDPMDPQNGATRFGIGPHRLSSPADTANEDWFRAEGRLLQMSLPAGCESCTRCRTTLQGDAGPWPVSTSKPGCRACVTSAFPRP